MRPGSSLLLALASSALLSGCGPDERALVDVSWRFADGRRCDATGAARVRLSSSGIDCAPSSGCSFACTDGEGDSTVAVQLTAGARLSATAESPSGAALYRGSLALPSPLPEGVTVELRYSGGE